MCPLDPAKRPKRKKSSYPRNLVGSGGHIESAIFWAGMEGGVLA